MKKSASQLQRRSHLKMMTDGRRRVDGKRTPAAYIYYNLTYEPSAQVKCSSELKQTLTVAFKVQGVKVKSMQRSETEAIRAQILPSKPKREITSLQIVKIQREHTVNRVSSYFPLAAQTELKYYEQT